LSKHSPAEMINFLRLFQQTHILNTAALKQTLLNSILQSRYAVTSLNDWEMHLQAATLWFIAQVSYQRQLKLHFRLKTVRESLHGRVIRHGLWPLHSPDLTTCDFYLWGRLKDNLYKTNPNTLEDLRNNIRLEISTISGQEHQRVDNVFRSYTECIRSGGQHFQHLL
jgi:hypothetical protein